MVQAAIRESLIAACDSPTGASREIIRFFQRGEMYERNAILN
jgi:hypothetical protein